MNLENKKGMNMNLHIQYLINEQGNKTAVWIPFGEWMEIVETYHLPIQENGSQQRPFGLCKGEFVVPDDFDAPLSYQNV